MYVWFRVWCAALAAVALAGGSLAAPGTEDLANQRSAAEQQRTDLRTRIQALQKELDARESVRKEAADALKASEVAISHITRRLNELAAQLKKARTELESLKKQIVRQQATLTQRRDELSDQLRRQYASGLSPWTALLSGEDPQELSRNLTYLDYVSQARAKVVSELKIEIERLAQLEAQLACEPQSFAVEQTGGRLSLQAGAHAGLRVGDKLMLADASVLPRHTLEPSALDAAVLAEVKSVTPYQAEIQQVAGRKQKFNGAWVAWPYTY